jgi:hypothetical protein
VTVSTNKMGPKKGDLEPKLIIDVWDDNIPAANLALVSSWRIIARMRGAASTLFIDVAPVFTIDPNDNSKGYLTHTWLAGQTDTPGVIELEVEAMWPGARPQSFPNGGYTTITIGEAMT